MPSILEPVWFVVSFWARAAVTGLKHAAIQAEREYNRHGSETHHCYMLWPRGVDCRGLSKRLSSRFGCWPRVSRDFANTLRKRVCSTPLNVCAWYRKTLRAHISAASGTTPGQPYAMNSTCDMA